MYLKDHWNRFSIIVPTVQEDTLYNMGLYPRNATILINRCDNWYLSYLPTNAIFSRIWHKKWLKLILWSFHLELVRFPFLP